MTPFLWFWSSFLIIAPIVLIVLTFIPGVRAASARQTARSVGLALPVGKQEVLERRFASRTRASSTGGAIGTALVMAGLVSGAIPAAAEPVLGGAGELWLVVGGFFVGMAFASAIRALSERTPAVTGERYARPGAVDVRDYVAPIDLIGARLAVAAGVLVLALASTFVFAILGPTSNNPLFSVGALVVLLGVVSLVVFEISARRILDRAQPAASPEDLAWDDAIRALTVREIVGAPLSLGVWGGLAVGLTMPSLSSHDVGWWGKLIVLILVVIIAFGILIAAVVSIATKPQQHYLRRLWPDVATRGAQQAVLDQQAAVARAAADGTYR